MLKPADLFDLSRTEHAAIFEGCEYAWEALRRLRAYIAKTLSPALHHREVGPSWIDRDVFIGEGTVVEAGVMIKGPAIIGRNCQIRHNAYLRGDVIVGNDCVVGNSCELKHSLLFDHCQVPHYNYVGDSILGFKAHLGAGVKVSNIKLDGTHVLVDLNGSPHDTGLRKFGALIGDRTDIGCNAVLNPGSVIGRSCVLYPGVNWRGILPDNRIVKNRALPEVVIRETRTKNGL